MEIRRRLMVGSVALVSAAGVVFGGALPAEAAPSVTPVLNCVLTTAQGPLSPAGSLRVVGKLVRLVGPATNATATATAKCPANTSLIGGGVKVLHYGTGAVTAVGSNYPSSQRIWTAVGVALSLPGKDIMTVTAYALCTLRT
jgi:hypothetical protein